LGWTGTDTGTGTVQDSGGQPSARRSQPGQNEYQYTDGADDIANVYLNVVYAVVIVATSKETAEAQGTRWQGTGAEAPTSGLVLRRVR
jgi:hypothetical protein